MKESSVYYRTTTLPHVAYNDCPGSKRAIADDDEDEDMWLGLA